MNVLNNGNLVENTIEVFSANWKCNVNKSSYVKLGNVKINLTRGFNILTLKGKNLNLFSTYDSCFDEYSGGIQKSLKKIYDRQEYDYLIMVTHDDCTNRTNPFVLQNYLIFLDCEKLKEIQFRGSYLLVYDLKKRFLQTEICDNNFPIHEWFEITSKENEIYLENLGIPVYLIVYNLCYFAKNSVEQLKKYTKNIHIIDNKSTYPELLKYYDEEYEFFLDKMEKNCGHLVWKNDYYWQFPKYFVISDPDLQFNKNLPLNFLEILKNLSNQYKKGKVGFALDLSDSHLFYQDEQYTFCSIEVWEKRFWLSQIDNSEYELYNADIDTTFALVNKEFEATNANAIRIAGDFTCKHLPWYDGWHKKIDENEWNFYLMNNISSSIVKMILKLENKQNEETILFFNETDKLLNYNYELISKIKESKMIDDLKIELIDNLNQSVTLIIKNKGILSKNVINN